MKLPEDIHNNFDKKAQESVNFLKPLTNSSAASKLALEQGVVRCNILPHTTHS